MQTELPKRSYRLDDKWCIYKKKKRKTILSKVNATVCRLDFSCWYFFFVVILFRSPCRLFLNSTHMYMYLAKLINEDALKCRTLTTYLMGCP